MLVAAPAQAAPAERSTKLSAALGASGLQAADLERGLALIDEIPEYALLSGDVALQGWVATNHPEMLRDARADIVGCAGAIASLIASTAIPAAKIVKIKRLIETLGGGAAGALAAELLGISSVQQKCFS